MLLLLRERPGHGYQLLDELPRVLPAGRVDMGNLYRALRSLEEDGLVSSEWHEELPGPAKRTYRLTDAGRALLDRWAEALRSARGEIDLFLERYEGGR